MCNLFFHINYIIHVVDGQHEQYINVLHQEIIDPTQLHLAPSQCTIKWNHPNDTAVGTLTVAEIKVYVVHIYNE